jgi:4-hydroxyphenylacetate 3-monooxygenase
MTEAIGIEQFPHVQGDIAEVIVTLEQAKALVRAAEADAAPNEYGVMTPAWAPLNANRNWYPKTYQRFPEIIRKLGASGLMALPTEADIEGDAHDDIEAYLTSATLTGTERVRLFRLAWDIAISAFAGRQTLYEYYFFGDPVRMAGAFVGSVDREPYKQRVRDFLVRDDAAVATA